MANRTRLALALIGVFCLLALTSCGGGSSNNPTATEANSTTTASIGAGLSGPAGLIAAVYTAGPANIAALAFDGSGQLWLGTAAFTDTGQDGVYLVAKQGAAPVQIIAGLHTVLGLLWYQGSLYVASATGVEAYSGFADSAFAQRRPILPVPPGTGEVNELALGPDGRMRLGISAPCDHCNPSGEWSASVISFLPDGSDVQVEASGIRAAVGLAYAPGTSDLFVTMNQRDDLGDATPGDWLSVVADGQDWGFPDCYGQGGSACSGAPTPVAELDAHAAVSGVAFVEGELAGSASGTAAIVAEWATSKVLRVSLAKDANGSYTGTPTTFIEGIDSPMAVLAGPNGTLLIGDWASGKVYTIS